MSLPRFCQFRSFVIRQEFVWTLGVNSKALKPESNMEATDIRSMTCNPGSPYTGECVKILCPNSARLGLRSHWARIQTLLSSVWYILESVFRNFGIVV